MFRFLPGIVAAQLAAIALLLLFPDVAADYTWAKIGVLLLVLAVLIALWFKSLALHMSKDEVVRLKEQFAREREELRVKAERDKHRLLRQSHKEIAKETRRAHTRANAKVTTAVAGVAGVGALLLFTQFMTVGLLALSGAGGAAFGYFARLRQETKNNTNALPKVVNPTALETPGKKRKT